MFDGAVVVRAVWLLTGVTGRAIAISLGAEGGVLWSDHHDDRVLNGENDQSEQDGGHEQSLRRCVVLANLEESDPQEPDTNGGNSDDRRREEEENQKKEQYVINGKDLGRLNENPVDRLEDVDMPEDVAAADLAGRILGLVDTSDEHAGEDEESYNHEEKAANEFQRAEYSLDLDPCLHDPIAVCAAGFGGKTLAADEGTFFTNERFQFTAISSVQSIFAALVPALELTLAFTVRLELRSRIRG